MIKSIDFPGKEFSSKAELFKALKSDKDRIISIKKAAIKTSDSLSVETKAVQNITKGVNVPKGSSFHVINTTGVIDSHNDFHAKGIWNKSVKEKQNKIFFLADHTMSIKNIIAYPEDVTMSVKDIQWSELGYEYKGSTEALTFQVDRKDVQLEEAAKIIDKAININHSVSMQYVKIDLAVNSEESEYKEELKTWDSYIENVGNKAEAEELGYMWVVSEAKIFNEGSMVVIGSNQHTPMINSTEDIQPSKDTDKNEPSKDTQNKQALNEKAKRELLLQLIKN